MLKKIYAITALFALSIVLSACGNNKTENMDGEEDNSTNEEEMLESKNEEGEDEEEQEQEPEKSEEESISAELTDEDEIIVLEELNAMAQTPEAEIDPFYPWEFTGLELDQNTWTVEFTNSNGESNISFDYEGAAVKDEGINFDWMAKLAFAMTDWQKENLPE